MTYIVLFFAFAILGAGCASNDINRTISNQRFQSGADPSSGDVQSAEVACLNRYVFENYPEVHRTDKKIATVSYSIKPERSHEFRLNSRIEVVGTAVDERKIGGNYDEVSVELAERCNGGFQFTIRDGPVRSLVDVVPRAGAWHVASIRVESVD